MKKDTASQAVLLLSSLACFGLIASQSYDLVEWAWIAVPVLVAICLELGAARLPEWGFVSCSTGWYFVVAASPKGGVGLAVSTFLTALLLRTRLRPSRLSTLELACDVSALLLSVLPFLFGGGAPWCWLVGAALYWLTFQYLPRLLCQDYLPLWVLTRYRATAILGISFLLGFQLHRSNSVSDSLVAVAISVGLAYLATRVVGTEEIQEQRLAVVHLSVRERQHQRLKQEIEMLQRGEKLQAKQLRFLSTVQAVFGKGATSLNEALGGFSKLVKGATKSHAVGVFLYNDQGLFPYLWEGENEGESTKPSRLTDVPQSSLIALAWQEDRDLQIPIGPTRSSGDSALAVPISGYGVLYLERRGGRYSERTVETVRLAARQAAVSLGPLAERAKERRSLAFISDEKRRLQRWVSLLHQLLEFSGNLSQASEESEVLKKTHETLFRLLPLHGLGWLSPGDSEKSLARVADPGEVSKLKAELHRAGGRPVQMGRLLAQELAVGKRALVVASDSLEEEHKQIFSLLLSLVNASLETLRLREEYAAASKQAAVGQIAAGLSHELNTPFGAIRLGVDSALLFLKKQPDKAEARLEAVQQSIARAQRILKGLLYYATSYGVERERVNLGQVLEQSVEAAKAQVELETISDRGQIMIDGFPLDLEEMFTQVLDNAHQATAQSDQPGVSVSLTSADGAASIDIQDNGIGIPEEIKDRIFDPFFTSRDVGQGLGLGLAVARRIAELHEGGLELVHSRAGSTRFRVVLPLASAVRAGETPT